MQLLVSESADSGDPMGVATLTVERSTSFIGEILVYWSVEVGGQDDIEPASGNLTFADVSHYDIHCSTSIIHLSCLQSYSLLSNMEKWEWARNRAS